MIKCVKRILKPIFSYAYYAYFTVRNKIRIIRAVALWDLAWNFKIFEATLALGYQFSFWEACNNPPGPGALTFDPTEGFVPKLRCTVLRIHDPPLWLLKSWIRHCAREFMQSAPTKQWCTSAIILCITYNLGSKDVAVLRSTVNAGVGCTFALFVLVLFVWLTRVPCGWPVISQSINDRLMFIITACHRCMWPDQIDQ